MTLTLRILDNGDCGHNLHVVDERLLSPCARASAICCELRFIGASGRRLRTERVAPAVASDRSDMMGTVPFLTRQEIYDRSAEHLLEQRRAFLDRNGGPAYRGLLGGCPVAKLICPVDITRAIAGVPVRFLLAFASGWTTHLDASVTALRSALLRARVNVYDEQTVALLSELQDLHDLSGLREWPERLRSIARDHGLDCGRALTAHGQVRDRRVWLLEVRRGRGDR
jgi:hypothetical protein